MLLKYGHKAHIEANDVLTVGVSSNLRKRDAGRVLLTSTGENEVAHALLLC